MSKETVIQSLKEKYGRRATDSALDRELYSRDLAPVPAKVVKPFFQTVPDLIIRPATVDEIVDIVTLAAREKIPVTPRASGSTVFFNCVPVKGGIVLDLGLLNGVIALDRQAMTVTVGAATTWSDLEAQLNQEGFSCKSMPSSAPSASIGGWLSMKGYGIGSIKYGELADQVRSIDVVLPDGRARRADRASNPPLSWFAASEGTLGVITSIELELRTLTPMQHLLFHLADEHDLVSAMTLLNGQDSVPYNMHFSEAHFLKEMKALGHLDLDIDSGCLLSVDFEGEGATLARTDGLVENLQSRIKSLTMLPEEAAAAEWQERFRSIGLKRGGPTLLGGEVWLPVAQLSAYLNKVNKLGSTYKTTMMSYGHVVSREHATVMTMFFSDETKQVRYLLDLGLVKAIQDAGHQCGGSPYGVGLWNTPYLSRVYSRSELAELHNRKKQLDPENLMNPGKLYQAPPVLKPALFGLGMNMAATIRRFIS